MDEDGAMRSRADSDTRHQICFEIQALVSRQRELSAMLEEAEEADRIVHVFLHATSIFMSVSCAKLHIKVWTTMH